MLCLQHRKSTQSETRCNNSPLMLKFSTASKGDSTKTRKRSPGRALLLKICLSWEIPWDILLQAGKMLWGVSLPVCHALSISSRHLLLVSGLWESLIWPRTALPMSLQSIIKLIHHKENNKLSFPLFLKDKFLFLPRKKKKNQSVWMNMNFRQSVASTRW